MSETQNKELETTTHHAWPHIPQIQWEKVYGPISNTNISAFLFLIIILIFSIFAKRALNKENSKLKVWLLNFIGILDKNINESFHDKKFSRAHFPLIAWFFVIIFFWNLFWLLIDWVWTSITPNFLTYFRPINSDLNTSLVLASVTVITFLYISLKYSWVLWTVKWYLFNFSWTSLSEKVVNVFVWWLHLLSIPSTIASLSLRLFGNIFAWVVLIWVITYLWVLMSESFFEVWRIISIPFWFFEVFVAFIQAAVFFMLMISYFNQSKSSHH